MLIDRFVVGRFGAVFEHEACGQQCRFLIRREDQVIHPFEEVGAGLVAHAVGESAGEGVSLQEGADALAQELLGLIGQRPVEGQGG